MVIELHVYVVFSLELQVYVWNALVFSLAWGPVVTSRLKSGPSGIYHIHWCRVQPVGTNIWTCGCWKYFKGKEGLCTQWCATVYQCENQKKCPTVISFQWLLDNRANSAEGEGTPRLKRLDVSRTPILSPDHFIKTLNYNQQPIGADESRTPIPWLYFFI